MNRKVDPTEISIPQKVNEVEDYRELPPHPCVPPPRIPYMETPGRLMKK